MLQRKLDELLSNSLKNRIVSPAKINSVAIITTDEVLSKIEVQKEIEKMLNIRNSRIYSFRKFDRHDEVSFKHFSEKDINWKGQIVHPSFESFLAEPFDLLLNIYSEKNLYLEFATLKSNAGFKVGFSMGNQALFDLEIREKMDNFDRFTSEVKKYLQILQKLEN